MSGKGFGRWCQPETVLVVMRSSDDPAQVLSAIRYGEAWNSRLLLVQLAGANRLSDSQAADELSSPWVPDAAGLQSLFGRRLLSAEVLKRAFLLRDVTAQQLPAVTRTFNIDRVVVTQARGQDRTIQPGLEERLIATLDVPVWVLGRGVTLSLAKPQPVRRILLPIAPSPELAFMLKFALQLAKSEQAILSVLHVFPRYFSVASAEERTPLAVKSWLAGPASQFSSPLCPMEISIRQGDPASEILEFNARKPHDLVLLRPSSQRHSGRDPQSRILTRLCSEMPCPILVLGDAIQFREQDTSLASPSIRHHRTNLRIQPLGMEG